jgi:hypothetical protein
VEGPRAALPPRFDEAAARAGPAPRRGAWLAPRAAAPRPAATVRSARTGAGPELRDAAAERLVGRAAPGRLEAAAGRGRAAAAGRRPAAGAVPRPTVAMAFEGRDALLAGAPPPDRAAPAERAPPAGRGEGAADRPPPPRDEAPGDGAAERDLPRAGAPALAAGALRVEAGADRRAAGTPGPAALPADRLFPEPPALLAMTPPLPGGRSPGPTPPGHRQSPSVPINRPARPGPLRPCISGPRPDRVRSGDAR